MCLKQGIVLDRSASHDALDEIDVKALLELGFGFAFERCPRRELLGAARRCGPGSW